MYNPRGLSDYVIADLGGDEILRSNHQQLCPGGEIGRHKGLKIPRLNGRAGSSPAPGTI